MSKRNVIVTDEDYLKNWMTQVERELSSLKAADHRASISGFTLPLSFRTRGDDGYPWILFQTDAGELAFRYVPTGDITIIGTP